MLGFIRSLRVYFLAICVFSLFIQPDASVMAKRLDNLSSTPNWTQVGPRTNTLLGSAVGSAGDVNGDGYDDVIVGALGLDNGQSDEGGAYLYYGSSTGLSASPDWFVDSNNAGGQMGFSATGAGDINCDSYDDVIVSVHSYPSNQDYGRIYVYYGSSTGLKTTPDWIINGNQRTGMAQGASVSSGDFNHDGCSDIIIGAHKYDNPEVDEGAVWVFWGAASGLSHNNGTVADADWMAEGNKEGGSFGYSVAAGDVNHDGFDDLFIGSYTFTSSSESLEGKVYMWYGSADGLGPNGSPANVDWTVEGDLANAWFGSSISVADINGDQYEDVIIGAFRYNEGAVFVWYGSSTGLPADASPLNAEWKMDNAGCANGLGLSVSSGDFNGDGYFDVLTGANSCSHPETQEGVAYMFYGSSDGLGEAGTPANADWLGEANQANAWFGEHVSTAGDVNGDGLDDIIIGADRYNSNTGAVYAFYSQSPFDIPTTISLSSSWIPENQPINTPVADITTTDPNPLDTFTYQLTNPGCGCNGSDNTLFNISGNQLQTSAVFNYESSSSYTICLRSTDSNGLSYQKQFTIAIIPKVPPTISELNPASTYTDSSGFTLTITGKRFFKDSVVFWNGNNLNTTFVSSTQLTAEVPPDYRLFAGTVKVVVVNPSQSDGTSEALDFVINNPVPMISRLTTPQFSDERDSFIMEIYGSGFNSNSVVRWNDIDLDSLFFGSTELVAKIPVDYLSLVGSSSITVFNPEPEGGVSNAMEMNLHMTPTNLTTYNYGLDFVTFTWDPVEDQNLLTRYIIYRDGEFLASVNSSADAYKDRTALCSTTYVYTVNSYLASPGFWSEPSNEIRVTTYDCPAPEITSLSPSSALLGSSGGTLNVVGSQFTPQSVVRWNGSDLATTFIEESLLQAVLPANKLTTSGTFNVTVFRPTPGGGVSNALSFTVRSQSPTRTPVITYTPRPTATPAPTFTPTPTFAPTQPSVDVEPRLDCVQNNGSGNYTAYFGYTNRKSSTASIPIGVNNQFSPVPVDRGQPVTFSSGSSPSWPYSAFSVNFNGSNLAWVLNGHSITVSSGSHQCPQPTPAPFSITKTSPDHGVGGLPNNINIHGKGFLGGTLAYINPICPVSLTSLPSSAVLMTTELINNKHLRATVPAEQPEGSYALLAANPDGQIICLPDAYTVLPSNRDDFFASDYDFWNSPAVLRANSTVDLGLVLHRNGGENQVSDVIVRFYLGERDFGGRLIGDGYVDLLDKNNSRESSSVSWTVPDETGEYTLYAYVDPDNHFTETDENNNVIVRKVKVEAEAKDIIPPQIESFISKDGLYLNQTSASLILTATDSGSNLVSGVNAVYLVEYEYNQVAAEWIPVQSSSWMDYKKSPYSFKWDLISDPGLHYLRVWVSDRAGNISLKPAEVLINYQPGKSKILRGLVHLYREELTAGQTARISLTSQNGDADLYLWAPDNSLVAFSQTTASVDEIIYTIPTDGIYQVEVYGYQTTDYQLTVAAQHEGVSQLRSLRSAGEKELPSEPLIAIDNRPADKAAQPDTPPRMLLYLPFINTMQ